MSNQDNDNSQRPESRIDSRNLGPLNESLQLLKTFNPAHVYIMNNYVDVMDSYSSWRISKIIEVKDDVATINFDGWSSKWNEMVKINGNKIAPFKKHTAPYSGGQKQAVREFDFEKVEYKNHIIKAINQMETIASSKFLTGEPYFITQYVRGEVYILVDAVLSITQPVKGSDMKLITEFIDSFIQFFVKYLDILPGLTKEYIEGRAVNPLLYLVNDKIAVVSCFPEMLDTMTKLFGGNTRCLKLYQACEFGIKAPQTVYATKPRDKFSSHHNQIVNNINYFGSLGGFEKLFSLLKWEIKFDPKASKGEVGDKDNLYRFPMHLMKHVLPMINPICSLMSNSFKESFFKEFRSVFFDRIDKITNREMKENDIHQVLTLIRESFSTFEDFYGKEAYQLIEQAEFDFTLKMLKSPYLEKKIKALNEFKDFFDRSDPDIDPRQLGDKRRFRFLTRDRLKALIIQKQVLEYLLGDNFHAETLKRSTIITKFLASQNGLTNDHLNSMWKACENKHEATVRVVYEAIVEISNYLSIESLDYLFSKILLLPPEKFDECTINLIKDFSQNAMQVVANSTTNSYFSAKKKTPKYEFYGLKPLWDAIQDNSKLETQFVPQAFHAIATLLRNPNFKNEKERYLALCFENVKKGTSVPQSLFLSLHILATYTGQMNFLGSTLDDLLTKHHKEYNIFDMVVVDFERYIGQVVSVLEKLKIKGQVPENKSSFIFVGKYQHQTNVDHRLLFLENIISNLKKSEKDFTFDHLRRLWNCLVKNAPTEIEQSAFLPWIIKSKDPSSSRAKFYIVNETLLKALFINVLCDKNQMDNFVKLTPDVFKCWERIFEILNEKEEALETGKNSIRILKFDQLIGVEVLWHMLIYTTNDKVLKSVKGLLVNVHLRIQSNNVETKLKIWQGFFDKCVEFLRTNNDPAILANVLSLMNLFIVNIEGKKYLNKDGPSQENISFIVVTKNEEQKKTVVLPSNATFFYLRKKISEEFSIPLNDFEILLLSGAKLTTDMEEEYMVSQIEHLKDKDREKDIIITLKQPTALSSVNLKEKIKNLVVSNQANMDNLFQLLSSSNTKIANDTWELLSFLPTNKKLKQDLEKLAIDSEESWSKILDVTCVRKLQYCLQIILDSINTSYHEPKEISDWCMKFTFKKGLAALIKIFFTFKIDDLKNPFHSKSFATLIKLLDYFLEEYPNFFIENQDDERKLITDILDKLLTGLTIVTKQSSTETSDDIDTLRNTFASFKELLQSSFAFLAACLKRHPFLVENVFNFPELRNLIQNGLIESRDISMRTDMANSIISLVETMNVVAADLKIEKPHLFFLSFFLDNFLKSIMSNRDKCSHFFYVIEHIYQNSTHEELEASKIDFHFLFESLIKEIINLKPFEATQADKDYLLQGILRFVNTLLNKNPKFRDHPILVQSNFTKEILHSCLFEIPQDVFSKDVTLPPKCKSLESRKAAFKLLATLCLDMNENFLRVIEYLRNLLLRNFWRTSSQSDWYIQPSVVERSKSGFVGLKNLGCTCYMNSLIQQFYMIPEFRETIMATDDFAQKLDLEDNLLYQLQLTFAALKMSQRQYFDPRGFCYAFKDYEGKPINVLEQMDVDEFFNNLLDKIENYLKTSKSETIIKRVFGGVLSNELICKGCPHYSEREEPFLGVSLQVKNKKSISESLQSFVQGEMLEGDNAYLCERCDKKVSTLKRVCIKKLPNMLMLVLKRFEFDFDTMQKIKVNDYCEFPLKLNVQQYTQAYLKKKEKQKKTEESGEALSPDDENNGEPEYPPEYYEYNLSGVVIHMGTAESGHYYSLIKDKNSNWFEFNDNIVRPFDLRDLAQEAFGGEEKLNLGNIGGNVSKGVKERNRNAYLLFYQRSTYFDEAGKIIPSLSLNTSKNDDKKEIVSPKILEEIKEDNYKFHMTKFTFDKEFSEFIIVIFQELNRNDYPLNTPARLEAAKFGILYLMTVPLRAKERDKLPYFLRESKILLRKSYELSYWLLKAFRSSKIIKEFLVSCAVRDMKYFVVGLIKIAAENCYSREKSWDYPSYLKESKLFWMLDSFIYTMYELKDQVKMLDKVFDVLMIASSLEGHPRLYLLKKKMIGRIIYYINSIKLPSSYGDWREYPEDSTEEPKELGEPAEQLNRKTDLIKSMNDILEKKKEKMILENTSLNFNGLVVTLSKLVMSLQLGNPPSEAYLPYELTDDERNILFANQNIIESIINESTSKKGRQASSSMLAHMAVKNEELTQILFAIVDKELDDRDEGQLKIYLQILEKLLLITDDLQSIRVDKGVKILMQTIKQNLQFYIATEICIEYLFKMCSRNPLVLKTVSEEKSFLKNLDTWVREHSNLQASLINQRIKLVKKREAKYSSQILQQHSNKFLSKCQDRITKLKKINKNEVDGLEPDYDSDEDFSDHKFELGEKIDFCTDNYGWVSASVVDNLDEMINIKYLNDQTIWIHYDSEKLGPYMKVQMHTKNDVDFYR